MSNLCSNTILLIICTPLPSGISTLKTTPAELRLCSDEWPALFSTDIYRNTSNINTMLEALDWPTLERRHQMARLSKLCKIHSSLVHWHCPGLKSKPPPPLPTHPSKDTVQELFPSAQNNQGLEENGTACPRKWLRPPHLTLLCQGLPINPCNTRHLQGSCDWSCHKHPSDQNMGCSSLFPE